MSKSRKETGKVIKKKTHRRVSLPKLMRLDVMILGVIVLLIVVGVYLIFFPPPTLTATPPPKPPLQQIREGVKAVFTDKNLSASLTLTYRVRGAYPLENSTLSVLDYVYFLMGYDNVTGSNYVDFSSAPYLQPLFRGLGLTMVVVGNTTRLPLIDSPKEILFNTKVLSHLNISYQNYGKERDDVITLKISNMDGSASETITREVEIVKYGLTVNIANTTSRDVKAFLWVDKEFQIPLKAEYVIDDKYVLTLVLEAVRKA